MPRRYGSKKKFTKGKRRYKKNYTSFTNKVKSIVRNQVLESKYSPQVNLNSAISSSGYTQLLNGVAQGDTNETRSGNLVDFKSLYLKGYLTNHASATNGTWIKVSVVLDRQQIGDTAPSFTDIYESTQPDASLKKSNLGRFKILYSKNFVINQSFSGQVKLHKFNIFKSFNRYPIKTRYNGTTSTDIQKNGIYLAVISNQSTNTPTPDFETRLKFVDG